MGKWVRWFNELKKEDFQLCGGKASHLGEMTCMGIRVPEGFSIVAETFYEHLRANKLEEPIKKICQSINYDDVIDVEKKTAEIRNLIEEKPIPSEIEEEIICNYEKMGPDTYVAVRSSVAVKDSQISSFPGLMDTYHYLKGSEKVLEYVKKCWASVWTARATCARHQRGIEHSRAIIAPIVQRMVHPKCAGVMFTLNPVNGDLSKVVIEGAWGVGEGVVSGNITPDRYVVDKVTEEILEKSISDKEKQYTFDPELNRPTYRPVPEEMRRKPCLNDEEIRELVRLAKLIEKHYGVAMDIEWAVDTRGEYPDNIYMLQCRPESVWSKRPTESKVGRVDPFSLVANRARQVIRLAS